MIYPHSHISEFLYTSDSTMRKPLRMFYDYIGESYVSYVCMGIRRQVKVHSDSVSLIGLLEEMVSTPEIMTKTRYTDHCQERNDIRLQISEKEFDEHWGGSGLHHIDPNRVQTDIDELRHKAIAVEEFADQTIAHHDKKAISGTTTIPTFADVDACVDYLEKLYLKYYLLFHSTSQSTLLPTWQYDWKEIFYEPWIIT
jgi:hypothetical protein